MHSLKIIEIILILFLPVSSSPISEDDLNPLFAETTQKPPKDVCDCDDEFYGPDIDHGTIKSPGYPNIWCPAKVCDYIIAPKNDSKLHLELNDQNMYYGKKLHIYHIFERNGESYEIPLNSIDGDNWAISSYDGRQYTSGINVGFRIKYISEEDSNRHGFLLSFKRGYDETPVCPNPYVIVTENITSVQESLEMPYDTGCTYVLIPSFPPANNEFEKFQISASINDGYEVKINSLNRKNVVLSSYTSRNLEAFLFETSNLTIVSYRKFNAYSNNNYPLITAQLLKKPCDCKGFGTKVLNSTHSSITIESPGFPNQYCSHLDCKANIETSKDHNGDKIPLILIQSNVSLSEKDELRLRKSGGGDIFRYFEHSNPTFQYNRQIVLEEQDLELNYKTDYRLSERYFQTNFTRILVSEECVCSYFNGKVLDNEGDITVAISSKCNIMLCHFKLSRKSDRIALKFNVDKPGYGDVVYIFTEKSVDRYSHNLMTVERQLIYDNNHLEFSFSRLNVTTDQDAVLHFSWGSIPACHCGAENTTVGSNKSLIFTSPDYPMNYCSNFKCNTTFIAPDNHIFEINITYMFTEKYHDKLMFFDGNFSTLKPTKLFSGKYVNQGFQSKTSQIKFFFKTDSAVTEKGFEILIRAVPLPGHLSSSSSNWLFYFGSLILLLIFGSIIFIILKRYNIKVPKYINPSFHFDNSSATISINTLS